MEYSSYSSLLGNMDIFNMVFIIVGFSIGNLETHLLLEDFVLKWCNEGAVSIRKTVLPGMAIPMLKIRRPNGRLIFNMEIAIRR